MHQTLAPSHSTAAESVCNRQYEPAGASWASSTRLPLLDERSVLVLPWSTRRGTLYLWLEDGHPTRRYAVVIRRNDVLGDGGKIGDPQEVAQRRTRRSAVRIWRAAFADNVVDVDGPKVDAPAHDIRGVRHRRMKLRSGKDDDAARRDDKAHFWLEFQRFLRVRLDAGIAAYVLRSIPTALSIPSVVIKIARSVLNTAAPITGMEGHSILGDEFVHGRPPIELTHRRRIPGVAMGMVGVRDSCRKIVSREGTAQTRYVLISLFGRAAKGIQDVLYKLLRTGVVDITRL